jgi:hypothetical protein
MFLQMTPFNIVTLGQTITDHINQMKTVAEYISYTKYAKKRYLGLVQSGSVWYH